MDNLPNNTPEFVKRIKALEEFEANNKGWDADPNGDKGDVYGTAYATLAKRAEVVSGLDEDEWDDWISEWHIARK